MREELASLSNNYKRVPPVSVAKDRQIIGSRWVYKVKLNLHGGVERFKARLVAKGYHQTKDVGETFAPVIRLSTIRFMLAVAAHEDYEAEVTDFVSTFTQARLEVPALVEQAEGYAEPGKEDWLMEVYFAMYGLKPAPRRWNVRLHNFIMGIYPVRQ